MKKFLTRRYLCLLLIFVFVFGGYGIFTLITGSTHTVYANFPASKTCESAEVFFGEDQERTQSELFEVVKISIRDGYAKAKIKATEKGTEPVSFKVVSVSPDGSKATNVVRESVRAGLFRIITNNLDSQLFIVLSVLSVLILAFYLYNFLSTLHTRRFSYDTVYFLSVVLIFALMLFIWSSATIYSFIQYHTTSALIVYSVNTNFMTAVTVVTLPLMLIYVLSVSVSNVVLMLREGFRPTNALGIITSVFMLGGLGVIAALAYLTQNTDNTILSVVYSVLSSLYVFFEIILLSAVICGVSAYRYTPAYDKDYIIILGCRIKDDGSLYPLIRGRADKAIEFWKKQKAATGKEACFIPSGGQGSDEIMSEGEAVARYLKDCGIPEEDILPETRSTTTKENMQFSKEIIDARTQNAKVVFSTTSYHVFRSGAIAYENGIGIDGIGSRTKWYFWPNAFLREVAGIFVNQPKKQILLTALIALAAGVGSYAYSLL